MDKPSHWVTFLNYMFNPMDGFVHILPKIGLKQPSIFWRHSIVKDAGDLYSTECNKLSAITSLVRSFIQYVFVIYV